MKLHVQLMLELQKMGAVCGDTSQFWPAAVGGPPATVFI